jgi:glycine cleavage system H protein
MSKGNFPEKLKYNEDYSWVKKDDDTVIIGVVDVSANNENEFVFIKLPEKGKKIKKGEVYVSIEAVKWSGHLSSPVSGEIVDVNEDLFNEPSRINQNPYKEWIMKVKLSDEKEINELKNSEEIKKYYEEKE